jgi:S-(hydroxymethyl)glutathione dehydrogenase/alcohol dehydrogenase
MKCRAALLFESPGAWKVSEVDLDPPHEHEVLLRMVATGLCHSDAHYLTGDLTPPLPMCGGHEGAGIVEEVGPGVRGLAVGDQVVISFIPGCGRCKPCATGHQNLCDMGAFIQRGPQLDGTYRMHHEGQDIHQFLMISTFSEYSVVSEWNCVKVPDDVPLETMCLLGCGVGTGWGSAVNSAEVEPGHVVIVAGIGGVGINAVQGAKHAGASTIIAVDPLAFKREKAQEMGATHAYDNFDEASEYAKSVTNGQGADSAILTIDLVTGEHVGQAFSAIRKGGTVVVTGMSRPDQNTIPVSLLELAGSQKRIQGSLYGAGSPSYDIPRQVEMWRAGQLKLDELITRRYPLDGINEAYDDMFAGRNIRGVVEFAL